MAVLDPDQKSLLALLPTTGSTIGNGKLREILGWDEARYAAAKEGLLNSKLVAAGRGRGGSLYRVVESDLELKSPEPEPVKEKKPKAAKRAKRGEDNEGDAAILSYRHDQRRVNNPFDGHVSVDQNHLTAQVQKDVRTLLLAHAVQRGWTYQQGS